MRVGLKSISGVILGLAILAGTATVPVFAAGSNDDTGNTKEPVSGRVSPSAAQCIPDDQGNCIRPHPLCSIVANDRDCNGEDPIDQKCDDAQPVQGGTADIDNLGYVELRYSKKCGSNWARVISYQPASLYGEIIREDNVRFHYSLSNTTLVYTDMVYAPVKKARACGTIDGHTACTDFF